MYVNKKGSYSYKFGTIYDSDDSSSDSDDSSSNGYYGCPVPQPAPPRKTKFIPKSIKTTKKKLPESSSDEIIESELMAILNAQRSSNSLSKWNRNTIGKKIYDIISKTKYVPTREEFDKLFKLLTYAKTKSILGESESSLSFYFKEIIKYFFLKFELTAAQFKICCGCVCATDHSNMLWLDATLKTYRPTNDDIKFIINRGYGYYIIHNKGIMLCEDDFYNIIKKSYSCEVFDNYMGLEILVEAANRSNITLKKDYTLTVSTMRMMTQML